MIWYNCIVTSASLCQKLNMEAQVRLLHETRVKWVEEFDFTTFHLLSSCSQFPSVTVLEAERKHLKKHHTHTCTHSSYSKKMHMHPAIRKISTLHKLTRCKAAPTQTHARCLFLSFFCFVFVSFLCVLPLIQPSNAASDCLLSPSPSSPLSFWFGLSPKTRIFSSKWVLLDSLSCSAWLLSRRTSVPLIAVGKKTHLHTTRTSIKAPYLCILDSAVFSLFSWVSTAHRKTDNMAVLLFFLN